LMNLSDTLIDLIPKIVVGAITAVIASYITVRLSLKRFYSEKWWEKKAEAYSAIIESLHHMKRYFDDVLEAEMSARKMPEDRKQELAQKSSKAHDELKKRIDIGHFVLSKEAVAELAAFEKAYLSVQDNPNWFEFLEMSWATINNTLKRMRDIAKADLQGR